MDEIKYLIDNFKGEIYNLCFEIMKKSKDQAAAFEFVCENFLSLPKNGTVSIEEYFTEQEIEEYTSIYAEILESFLYTNIKKCNYGMIEIEDFYKSLWDMICALFLTEKERAFAFYFIICSNSIPYQYMGKPLLMSNDRFRQLSEQNQASIDRVKYISRSRCAQRTERASLLLNCLNEIEDYDSQVVVLAHAISILGKDNLSIRSDRRDLESLLHQIDERIEELEVETDK